MCECNTGYVPSQDSCIPCQPNQIVEKDSCNGNAVCKNCPVGTHPNIDRCKCIDDDDDDTGDCEGWFCPIFKIYTAISKKGSKFSKFNIENIEPIFVLIL